VIPSEEEALALHRKYGSKEVIVRHCVVVAKVAKVLTDGFLRAGRPVDAAAVAAGALLHDIGRNRTQTVRHGLEGATILDGEGVDGSVVQIVRRHVGAGLSAEEAAKLGLPALDYIPRTLEERIVCFSDKLVDSDRVRPFKGEVERFVKKGHDVERLLGLKRGLQDELGEDPERLVLDKLKESE
jgi:uncharacterized protein (TIGR00295 family)